MEKRTKILSIALAATLLSSVAAAFAFSNNKVLDGGKTPIAKGAVQCVHHEGNHYDALSASVNNPGSLEYYVCCICHQAFIPDVDDEDIANGDWVDTHTTADYGEGGIAAKAYIPPTGPVNVTTLNELEHELERKTNLICVAADITVNRTVIATNGTVVYADSDHSLLRDPGFTGALFDVRNGCDLTIGKSDATGTLTLDGNNENVSDLANPLVSVYENGTLNLRDNAELANNYCSLSNGSSGGAVRNNGTFNMYGGVITNCKAQYGAAIFNNTTVNIINGTLHGNTASQGAGIYGNSGTVDVSSLTITGSSATYGAAMYIGSGTVTVNSSGAGTVVIGTPNSAQKATLGNTTSSHGGAIYIKGTASMSINDATIGYNSSTGDGGAIYATANSVVSLSETTLVGNSATGSSGAMYLGTSGTTTIDDCEFNYNSTAADAGAINANNARVVITDSSFDHNSTPYSAGAIYLQGTANVSVGNTEFTNNSGKNGGAIRSNGTSTLSMDGCTFTGNTAVNSGGALYFASTTQAEIDNSSFTSNVATAYYGGVGYFAAGAKAEFDTCTFTSNSAKNDGGAFNVNTGSSPTLSLIDATVEGNTSTDGRNFIHVNGSGRVTINGLTVVSNPTINIGGSGYVTVYNDSLHYAEHTWADLFIGGGATSNVTYL